MPDRDEQTEAITGHPQGIRDAATVAPSRQDQDVGGKQGDAENRSSAAGFSSLAEFSRDLVDIGLIDQAELDGFAADSAEGVLGLSRALIKAGKLTSYQAAAVYQQKSRGLLIGNYLILDKLGQGGMGMVFKARHRRLGRVGALKILPPSFARDRSAVLRFRREVEAAGRLKHPNVVAALDADEDRGVHFLVMDYVEGKDLDHAVQERGPLAVGQAVDCLIQAARGLDAAHAAGIVHRDIKPGNLILDQAGSVRVLDLGLARIVESSNPFNKTAARRLTESGMYMGTIDFMAPEQAEDSHRVDHRADIYSLGCTLFYLLTGREPFPGETVLKRLMAHMERPAPSLRLARADVSLALEEVYQKMMAKRPEDRPGSMNELVSLLEAAKNAPAPAAGSKPELKVFDETVLKRAGAPRTKAEPSIFARPKEAEGLSLGNEISLEDLVMDVRSEVHPPPLPAAARGSGGEQQPLKRISKAPSRRRGTSPGLLILGVGAPLVLLAVVAGILFSRNGTSSAPDVAATRKTAHGEPRETKPSPPVGSAVTVVPQPKRDATDATPAPAKSAAQGPYWILLAAGNRFEGHIPDEMASKLAELSKNNDEAKWVAFAPGGAWALLHGRNGYHCRGIPDPAYDAIIALGDKEAEIKSIVFSPEGGWLILHGRNGFEQQNLPDEVVTALGRARARGFEIRSVAFGPGNACVALFGRDGFYEKDTAKSLSKTLANRYATAAACYLGADGAWVVLDSATANGHSVYAADGLRIPGYSGQTPYVKLTSLHDQGQLKCYSYAVPAPALAAEPKHETTRKTVPKTTVQSAPPVKPATPSVVVGTDEIVKRLESRITLHFPEYTAFVGVLKFIKSATKKSPNDPGIPIFVDPIGLQELQKSARTAVKIDVASVPLKDALKQLLGQLGMVYRVKDDVLVISSPSGLDAIMRQRVNVALDASPATKATLARLEEPIPMTFTVETPLDDVLKYLKAATKKSASDPGLAFSIDPVGFQVAQKTMTSTVSLAMELEGVPLKTSLRHLIRQLNLAYVVGDGVVTITSRDLQIRTNVRRRN
jgi:serine/threonine protein kinase